MKRFPLVTMLATALALAVTCGALAQAAPDAAKQKELEAAREELHSAAKRVAELSRELGATNDVVVERRLHRRPVLGVILEPDTASGVRVAAVTPESAAAKAGLRSGDRLVSIDGKAIAGTDGEQRLADARARLRGIDTKTPMALGYVRDGRTASAKVTPEVGEPMWMMFDGEGNRFGPRGHVVMRDGKSGDLEVEADSGRGGAGRSADPPRDHPPRPRRQVQGRRLPISVAVGSLPLEWPQSRLGRQTARPLFRHRPRRAGPEPSARHGRTAARATCCRRWTAKPSTHRARR